MPIVASFGGLSAFGFGAFPGGDFEAISSVTVGSGGAAEIEFASIPATFAHLQIRMIQKFTTTSGIISNARAVFNADTGSNYTRHLLWAGSTSANAQGTTGLAYAWVGWPIDSNAARASMFSAAIVDILDYANTSKNTTVRTFFGEDYNGGGNTGIGSALWLDTSAITSIKLSSDTGNWAQHTTAALFGVKAP